MKKVRTTRIRFDFCKFFSLWQQQSLERAGDREHSESKSHRGKSTKTGGSDPHFFGFQPPKKFVGSLPPSGTVIRAACFFHGDRESASNKVCTRTPVKRACLGARSDVQFSKPYPFWSPCRGRLPQKCAGTKIFSHFFPSGGSLDI